MSCIKLLPKSISALAGEAFFVPAYQRGYRWTTTEVTDLLNDIWKFRIDSTEAKKDSYYSLQPLVVSPSPKGWIVIDGQQRLTTILLIMTYLKRQIDNFAASGFTISYETREGSKAYLENIDTEQREDNIDFYHMKQAYKAIDKWFSSKTQGNPRSNFVQTLMNTDEEGKNVKVIWYEVSESEAVNNIDIFTRLNVGKIRLTNAELIKAYLLQKKHFTAEKADLNQIQTSAEWDYIESILQRDDFWYFIYDLKNNPEYETRIEFIFDRMFMRNKDHEYYHTFHSFMSGDNVMLDSNGQVDIGSMWLKVKRHFQTFEEWYNDPELYHLIGYLICCGERTELLHQESQGIPKTQFKKQLYQKIKAAVDCDIEELEYGKDNELIKKVLLLFNILTLLKNKGDSRFPFHLYKLYKWDIEHISSQTEKDVDKRYRKEWIEDILEYFTGMSIGDFSEKSQAGEEIQGLKEADLQTCHTLIGLYNAETINEIEFSNIRSLIARQFGEKEEEVSKYVNSIGNLALLDATTNRSYKNAFFPIKRRQIIKNDRIGKFVPICTKNVFLKFYADKLGEVMYWKEADVTSYADAIKDMLNDFFHSTNTTTE